MSKDAPKVKTELPALGDDFFDAFDEATYEKWREAAEKALKGAPFEKKLLSKTYEGITLQPIYDREDAEVLPHLDGLPGFAPYTRGTKLMGYQEQSWQVSQEYPHLDPAALNEALRDDIERGLSSINIPLHPSTMRGQDLPCSDELNPRGMCLASKADLAEALEQISLEKYPIYIQCGQSGLPVLGMLVEELNTKQFDLAKLKGCIGSDPLAVLAGDGSLPLSLEDLFDQMAAMTSFGVEHAPGLKTIPVHTHVYHDAGADAVHELAFGLATGVEYVRALMERGLTCDDVAPRVRLNLSVGPDFFMEVAKLRAARIVWSLAMGALGASDEAKKLEIHARTSTRSQTLHDPYVNMLRATTECFSALVGGADSLHASPFDEIARNPDEFSRRISRNLQSVLKDECHLGQIIDPAGGSWFVEQLTDSVARKAWELFQSIEQRGGMTKALLEGYPQTQVAEVRKSRKKDLSARKSVIVGTNKYANLEEETLARGDGATSSFLTNRSKAAPLRDDKAVKAALGKLAKAKGPAIVEQAAAAAGAGATVNEILTSASRAKKGETLNVEPLRPVRDAELYEGLRKLAADYKKEHGHAPRVFLANMGPIPQHKARADFSRDFFAVGGFEVLGNNGFESAEAAAKAAVESGAPISVICSTDETYPELVPAYVKSLKQQKMKDAIVVLAGYPKDQVEQHKQSGVDEFIHLRANNHELLAGFFNCLGATK